MIEWDLIKPVSSKRTEGEYHPVTKEGTRTCLNCGKNTTCKLIQSYSVCWEEDTRPDPLALLEAWVRHESERGFKNHNHSQVVIAVCGMIDSIKSNPEAVRERGIKEGWINDC